MRSSCFEDHSQCCQPAGSSAGQFEDPFASPADCTPSPQKASHMKPLQEQRPSRGAGPLPRPAPPNSPPFAPTACLLVSPWQVIGENREEIVRIFQVW